MPTKSTHTIVDDSRHTRVDDQGKDPIDTKGPTKRNRPKQLQTHNLAANDVENINSTNTRRDLLLSNEQKRCCKGSRGTAELLYIDQHILDESKTRRKNLAMVWIDYKKAYDMVPHSWIINSLKMYKISNEVIDKTMKSWRVEVKAVGRRAEAKIQRGTFQGDALSPLLFRIAMIPLNRILRKCTAGYKFSRSQEKVNHLMYMDDIKLFAKSEK